MHEKSRCDSGQRFWTSFSICTAAGWTIAIVTHNQEVIAWCPRRIRMKDGLILDEERAS